MILPKRILDTRLEVTRQTVCIKGMLVRKGDIIKLRGVPKALSTKRRLKKRRGRVNDPGDGKNGRDTRVIRSQVLKPKLWMQFTD